MGRSKHSGGDWQEDVRKWVYDKLGGTGQRKAQLDRQECRAGMTDKCKKKPKK